MKNTNTNISTKYKIIPLTTFEDCEAANLILEDEKIQVKQINTFWLNHEQSAAIIAYKTKALRGSNKIANIK